MGQIMLQKNAWTGLLFLIGIAVNSLSMLVGALVGVFSGTVIACLLKFDPKEIEDGLYGFNGALVGIACALFIDDLTTALLCNVFGSIVSSLLMRVSLNFRLKPFTAPFIVVVWIIFLLGLFSKRIEDPVTAGSLNLLSAVSDGFGQVMFQENAMTGAIFLIGIGVSSRKSCMWALAGSVIGVCSAMVARYPVHAINQGLFGYNACLCGIALSGMHPAFGLAAIMLSTHVTPLFSMIGIPALTAPFVLATWIAHGASSLFPSREKESAPSPGSGLS